MADKFKFLYFKGSGKFYAEGEGNISRETFDRHNAGDSQGFWQGVCDENGGTLPGLSVSCTNMTIVIADDDATPHGYPLLFIGGFGL